MLDSKIAEKIIGHALEAGADFCDIYVEKNIQESMRINGSVVKDLNTGVEFGIGIRLLYGPQVLYGYTNSDKQDDLMHIVYSLSQNQKNKAKILQKTLTFNQGIIPNIQALVGPHKNMTQKMEKLFEFDKALRSGSKLIQEVDISAYVREQKVEIYNSEGLHVTEMRPYARISTSAIFKDGTNQVQAHENPGLRGDFNFINGLNVNAFAEKIIKRGEILLKAKPCPAGEFPVVIDNGFGGVIFHEACGHLLETTAVEKKASVMWDKMGEMIAGECVNAFDDGTIDNGWGSLSIDDEGMQTQKTQLIKDGKLVNFLCDRVGHIKTGHPRTGSGRKQSYKFAPASRMRNTFIANGQHSLEEMLASLDYGIYAKTMGGGSVSPATGEFNFSVSEAYIVEKGKIKDAVKGATLIGKGDEILKRISMAGNNLELAAGMCGSVSGSIPAAVGQPAVKVDKIIVGGQA